MRRCCSIVVALLISPVLLAATLTTRDGQIFDGDLHTLKNDNGQQSIAVTPTGGGFALQFPLSNINSISYRPPISGVLSGGTLLGDWAVRDIGETGLAGSANYAQGVFTLTGEGTPSTWRDDSLHYVYQRLAKEGDLTVHLSALSATNSNAMAGLMLRLTPEASSTYAMLDINAAGQSEFRAKPNPTTTDPVKVGSKIKPPCWIRLTVYRNVVTASQSLDGRKWEMAGRMAFGDIHNACIGMVVSSQKSDELATASFDHVRLQLKGIRGDYFAGTQFSDLRLTRIDPNIDFNWGVSAPDVQLPSSNFSVRWTGEFEGPSSDVYTFRFADGLSQWAKLWINGEEILDSRSTIYHSGKVKLEAQQRYSMHIDFCKTIHSGACQLLWSTDNMPEQVMPTEVFQYRRDADELPSAASPESRFVPIARGMLLVDGTFLPGALESIKDDHVHFRYRNRTDIDVPLQQCARFTFEPLASALAAKVSNKPGLLTRQGDFIEGECQSFEQNQLKLTSVVFGSSSYDATTQVAALILRAPSPSLKAWMIHSMTGAVLRAPTFDLDKDQLTATESLLGKLSIPTAELIDISGPPAP